MTVTILHNPHCSKSRATLALLQQHGIEPAVRLYLEDAPAAEELRSILAKLGIAAGELVRTGEADYRRLGLDRPGVTEEELIAAMAQHPALIERPIVLAGRKAALGRPPVRVLEIL